MRLKILFEDVSLGGKINASAYRSGPIHWTGDIFMHFGSKEAAEHAARNQTREISKYIITIEKTAVLKDSKAAHDQRPDKLAEDLVAGGTFPEQIINYVKNVMEKDGINAAFALLKKALENKGYDGISYINANEDPGSISYIIWDPYKARRVYGNEELHTKAEKIITQIEQLMNWKGWTNWSYNPTLDRDINPAVANNIFEAELYGEKLEKESEPKPGFHDEDEFAGGSSVGCEAKFDFNNNTVTIAPMSVGGGVDSKTFNLTKLNKIAEFVKYCFTWQSHGLWPT